MSKIFIWNDEVEPLNGTISPNTVVMWHDSTSGLLQYKDSANVVRVMGLANFGKTVTVGKTDANYTTLAAALADPIITGASISNPVAIIMYSGIFDEVDFIVPAFVDVIGLGNVILRPTAVTTSIFCTVKQDGSLQKIDIDGNGNASGVGAIGVEAAGGDIANVNDVMVIDFHTCFNATGANTNLVAENCRAEMGASNHVDTGFCAVVDATITLSHPSVLGKFANRIPQGYYCTGSGSVLNTSAGSAIFAEEAVVVDDLGEATINSLSIGACDKGLVTRNNGGATILRALNVSISTSTPIHHELNDNNVGAKFFSSGGRLDSSKITHSANVLIQVASLDERENDENFRIIGEISQGTPNRQSEANFGGGDSTTAGMTVQTNTNGEIGAWVDETAAAASASGSPVTMFPALIAESTIYLGRSNQFGGFKIVDLSTLMVLGAGAIVFEFWNGAAWVAVNVMETDATDLDDVRANSVFVTDVNGDLEVRIGDVTGWATKLLNGFTKFWLRIRVTTAITTAPVFQQSKLHTNSFTINPNGLIQRKGEARDIILDLFGRLEDLVGLAAGNQTIDSSPNTAVQIKNNNRSSSAKDGSGVVIALPNGIDTSFPMEVVVRWSTNNNGVGDVDNSSAICVYSTGDLLDNTLPEQVKNIITSLNAQTQEVQLDTFVFDISNAKPGDNINIGSLRDASAGNLNDTFGGNTFIVTMGAKFRRWR